MIPKAWTPQEITFLIKERSCNASTRSIANTLGRSMAAIHNKAQALVTSGQIQKIERNLCTKVIDTVSKFEFPEEQNFDGFLELQGDFISVSDVHVPFWNVELFKRMFSIAKKFNIKRLIINGDFLNMDAFSHYTSGFKGQDNMEKEFTSADYVLGKCLETFREIVITQGNHEDRLFRALQGQVGAERFFKMLHAEISTTKRPNPKARIRVSEYPFCHVNGIWKVVHPANFGSQGGVLPAKLADKYMMNVISGHNHQFGISMSLSGKYIGIDQGMGADERKIEYNQKSVNTYRSWQNGFTMVKNNYPYVFNLRFTDWNYWIK